MPKIKTSRFLALLGLEIAVFVVIGGLLFIHCQAPAENNFASAGQTAANADKIVQASPENINQADTDGKGDPDCQIIEEIKEVRGSSMAPLIKAGAELTLLSRYYHCHPAKRGDIVAYDYGGNDDPLIKRIRAVGHDRLEFRENNLLINDKILANSQGEAYRFSAPEKNMIGLYIKDGRLVEDGYLIFGDNTGSSLDSRKFGAVGKSGFLGRFIF